MFQWFYLFTSDKCDNCVFLLYITCCDTVRRRNTWKIFIMNNETKHSCNDDLREKKPFSAGMNAIHMQNFISDSKCL